jgi:hypothetical protein
MTASELLDSIVLSDFDKSEIALELLARGRYEN